MPDEKVPTPPVDWEPLSSPLSKSHRVLIGGVSIVVGVVGGGVSFVCAFALMKMLMAEDVEPTVLYQALGFSLAGALAMIAAVKAWDRWVELPHDVSKTNGQGLTVGELRNLLSGYPDETLVYAGSATQKTSIRHTLYFGGELVRSITDSKSSPEVPSHIILLL